MKFQSLDEGIWIVGIGINDFIGISLRRRSGNLWRNCSLRGLLFLAALTDKKKRQRQEKIFFHYVIIISKPMCNKIGAGKFLYIHHVLLYQQDMMYRLQ